MLRLTLVQIFTILIIIQPTTSLSQWSTDPNVNTAVCTVLNKYEVEFNESELTSGIYFYQINEGKFIQTKKMILIK
ncbi:MAG: T9SS type A sorting domain-containing protein [Ignavibacteriaceae bacterium]|nr:T9SS type A sorting domain-containing protein [Ignavibacteriaceae bacterium]